MARWANDPIKMVGRFILRLIIRLLIVGAAFLGAQFISGPAWFVNCLVPGFVFAVIAVIGVTLVNLLMTMDYPGRARRD